MELVKQRLPMTETQAAFVNDVEDADPGVGPEDDSSDSIIEAGSLVEIRKWVCGSFFKFSMTYVVEVPYIHMVSF
jgi:hypothetical protein